MTRYGIWVHGVEGAVINPYSVLREQWIAEYDPDAHGGLGEASGTDDPREALSFGSTMEAFNCWRQVSKVRPRRPDGKPNRPLTTFTVEIKELPL